MKSTIIVLMKRSLIGAMLFGTSLLFGGGLFAQDQSAKSTPPTRDGLREQYTRTDFENFLKKVKNGDIPSQSGPVLTTEKNRNILQKAGSVFSSAPADALANNNAGAGATANFTQSETSILAFGSNVVIGFNDSGSNSGGTNKFTGFAYSTDGGATFTDGGTLPTNTGGDAGDPVLARNESTGRIYFATLGFSVSTIQVFRSDNNGVTWMAPVNGSPGGSTEDKEWITVDNFPGAGAGNVYLISRRFGSPAGIYMFRSTDHGNTFGPTGGTLLVSGNQGAFVTVGPDHAVYAFWWTSTSLQMRKSTDFGATFGATVTVVSGLTGGTNGDLGLTGIRQGTSTASAFRSNSFPHAAINPVSGHIYVTFNDNPAGTDKADVYMVMSTDGGATWSARVRVNDDATTTDQWQPTIAVTPNGVGLGIFYYSRQEDPANNLFKYYGRTGIISGSTVTFTPSFAISDVASLPEFGRDSVVNSTYMGDYNHAAATATAFHVSWSDNRDDLAGGAPRKDPNVYYESIQAGLLSGPNISVNPTTVDFGSVAVTATGGPRQITIVNNGDASLTVSAISSPAPDFSLSNIPPLPAVIPSAGFITLSATFSPASLGTQNSSFTITSNALNTPVVTVNLSGTGVANISVSPLSINFGDVAVGQAAGPTPVTIQNPGTVNLTVTAISTPAGDFSLTHPALPLVLPPLGSATVNTFFSPTSAGPHSSSFDITSSAIAAPTVTVNLQGNGIVPPPNDLCANAIPLDCGASINGTTVLATFDNVGTCGTSNTAPGVWYTVIGNGRPVTVSTCIAASYDTKISVFSGTCGARVCVGGNDDFSGCGLRSQVTFNSVAGTTYYVLVHGFLSQVGTFTLSTSACPPEIAVSPAALNYAVPLNGTASKSLTIANSADPGASNLLWIMRSQAGAVAPGQGAQPTVDAQPQAWFQITEATLNALRTLHLPAPILRGLESLTSQPPSAKEDFVNMLNSAIGAENTQSFYLAIMENSIRFDNEVKEIAQEPAPGNATPSRVGGPDGFGYRFIDSDEPGGPVFNWIDITGTGTPIVLSDDASILVPMSFVFPFYGDFKNEVRISSNGYLTFGTSGTTFTNASIPSTAIPNDIICPFWDDLNPGVGGTIHYLSTATQFIVQYTNVPHFGSTGVYTFQVILNADGSMLYQYLNMQGLLTSATVGIENAGGTIGLQVVFNAAYVHNNLAVRVFFPLPPACTWVSSLVPSSGTIPAGNSQQVAAGVDVTGLPIGVYECHLSVLSNAINASQVDVPVTVIVGTPVERIDDLIAQIQALQTAGVLNSGQANSLINKLQEAKNSLNRGQTNTALNQLQAFINEVNAYMQGGILTAQQGGDLLDDVNMIITLLLNGTQFAKPGAQEASAIPDRFALIQNYPNPFNPATVIRYDLPIDAHVRLEVFNIFGQTVAQLVDGRKPAGSYEVIFDASRIASGMYFYRLSTFGADGKPLVMIKKMMLMK